MPNTDYRFLDNQKNTHSQFSFPGLWEVHRNLKQNKDFNSCKSFFRNSHFVFFFCINPGTGGPWDKLWIFFLIAIFIMLQENAFGQIFFWISCMGSKVPFWNNWNPWMKFEKKFGQKHSLEALRKWQYKKISMTCPRVCQIQDLCRKKYKKGIFYKSPGEN